MFGALLPIIDPYKVDPGLAHRIVSSALDSGLNSVVLASTDNRDFFGVVQPLAKSLREVFPELELFTHFPKNTRGHSFVTTHATGYFDTNVLNSTYTSQQDRVHGTNELTAADYEHAQIRRIPVSAITFGWDIKSFYYVGAKYVSTSPSSLRGYYNLISSLTDDSLLYLYCRRRRVPFSVCRAFRANLGPKTQIVVSGNISTSAEVREYLLSGANTVAVGSALCSIEISELIPKWLNW